MKQVVKEFRLLLFVYGLRFCLILVPKDSFEFVRFADFLKDLLRLNQLRQKRFLNRREEP